MKLWIDSDNFPINQKNPVNIRRNRGWEFQDPDDQIWRQIASLSSVNRIETLYERYLGHTASLKFSVDLPKGEQYDDYMGTLDVSPKDPKALDDQQEEWAIRKDLEKMYFERGLHNTVMMPQTDRPLTPFASLKFATMGLPVGHRLRDLQNAPDVLLCDDPELITEHNLSNPFEVFNVIWRGAGLIGVAFYCKNPEHGYHYPESGYTFLKHLFIPPTTTASLPFHTDVRLHKPNTLLVHEGVFDALIFEESEKDNFVNRNEWRDDFVYAVPKEE